MTQMTYFSNYNNLLCLHLNCKPHFLTKIRMSADSSPASGEAAMHVDLHATKSPTDAVAGDSKRREKRGAKSIVPRTPRDALSGIPSTNPRPEHGS